MSDYYLDGNLSRAIAILEHRLLCITFDGNVRIVVV